MAEEPPTKRKCLGADCENDAGTLQCPTCLKLGIKDSYFCSQDCFKKNWVSRRGNSLTSTGSQAANVGQRQGTHKSMHKQESSKLPSSLSPTLCPSSV